MFFIHFEFASAEFGILSAAADGMRQAEALLTDYVEKEKSHD